MAIVDETVSLNEDTLARVQEELKAQGLQAWLLYNFLGVNPVASGLLGLPAMTRRYFVLIPARGRPVALTHRIEQLIALPIETLDRETLKAKLDAIGTSSPFPNREEEAA